MAGILHKCFEGCASTTLRKPPPTTLDYLCQRYSLSQIREWTGDFDERRIFADGGLGVLYRARVSINGDLKDIAVKRIRRDATISVLSLYKNEIIFMCQLQHPNLVPLLGFCDENKERIAVYDYSPNGTLFQQLRSKSPALSWKKRLEVGIGVARGLHYLHSGTKRTVIHRDIKPSNILLGENWVPKLAYFAIAVRGPKFSEKNWKPKEVEMAGTFLYMAPESAVTYKWDVYSFGVVLLDLICGDTPTKIILEREASSVKELYDLVERGKGEGIVDENLEGEGEIEAECWELYMKIIESCLSEDPYERPDMGDVEVQLQHILHLQLEADANRALNITRVN